MLKSIKEIFKSSTKTVVHNFKYVITKLHATVLKLYLMHILQADLSTPLVYL